MKKLLILSFISFSAISGTQQTAQPGSPPDIAHYLSSKNSTHNVDVNDTVYQMLTEAGKTEGFRAGKAQRAWELKQALLQRAAELDATYSFAPLINSQGWLPPVITEAKSLASVTDRQMRTATAAYHIVIPEKFVSNPPGWRKYLFAGLTPAGSESTDSVIPRNSAERHLWQEALRTGWEKGRISADRTLEANFNRLTRDYTGRLRYTLLLKQGMVTAPVIGEQHQSVTGTPSQLTLGDRVRELKKNASFELDKKRWRPVIRTQE